MSSTISKLSHKINLKINKVSNSSQIITDENYINDVLDAINKTRKDIKHYSEQARALEKLFTDITWLDIETEEEEKAIKKALTTAREYNKLLVQQFNLYKKNLYPNNICKKEIEQLEIAIEDFEETVDEVEEIFFVLRKDEEFKKLANS